MGGGAPAYVIAEAGANHNRDLGIARELIDVAADAGADAVKFQTYSGERPLLAQDARVRVPRGRRTPAGAARGDLAAARVAGGAGRARRASAASHFFSSPFDHEAVTSSPRSACRR